MTLFKIIDYVKVYQDRKIINGVLYPRYFIHEDKEIGIPNGVSFYRKNETSKYIRLTSTDTVKGMSIRYDSKDTQVSALLKIIKIKAMQPDSRYTVDLKANKRSASKNGINKTLPSGVCVLPRTINNNVYNRVVVNVFNLDKNRFCPVHLHAGRVEDAVRLQETINRAVEMRKQSLALVASLVEINRHTVV